MKGIKRLIVSILPLLFLVPMPSSAAPSKEEIRRDIKKLLSKRNILALPLLTKQVTAFNRSKTRTRYSAASTTPTLISIPSLSIKQLFWRDIDGVNVVDALNSNNFSAPYCGEFYTGNENGASGGLGACHMAESVGFTYKTIVLSGTSFCYMQNFPTKNNLIAGGITLNSGTLPAGGIVQLFATPSGTTPRIVKVNLSQGSESPGSLYFQISPSATNLAAKNLFEAKLWLCNNQEVQGYDIIAVTNSLRYTTTHGDTSPKSTFVDGRLTVSGNKLLWDSTQKRTGSTVLADEDGFGFKSEFEITKDNIIRLKRVDNFEGRQGRGLFLTKFSGGSTSNIKFSSGAFNEIYRDVPILNAAAFNGTYYEVNQNSALLAEVSSEDLNSGYYTSGLQSNVDTSQFSCDTSANLELTLDLLNPTVQGSLLPCDEALSQLQNMRFCLNDDIAAADENAVNSCS